MKVEGRKTLIIIALSCLLLATCTTGSPVDIWFVDSLVKVFQDDEPSSFPSAEARILVPRNGHGSLQLCVRPTQSLEEFEASLQWEDMEPVGIDLQLRAVGYVPVESNTPDTPQEELIRTAPDLFPDPLFNEIPSELEADQTVSLWITVAVDNDVAQGEYDAVATISGDGIGLQTLPFTISVVPARVPQVQTLSVTNWFYLDEDRMADFYELHHSEDYWTLLANLARVMAEHRQNVILTPVSSLTEVTVREGQFEFDFSRLDRWIEIFKTAGFLGPVEGGHLLTREKGYFSDVVAPVYVAENNEAVPRRLPPDDTRARAYFDAFLPALYSHIQERGWKGTYYQHILDEPHDDETEVYEQYGQLVQKWMPGIKTVDAVDLEENDGFLDRYLDYWVPVLGSFDEQLDVLASHTDRDGKGTWYYTCITPRGHYLNRFIDYSLLKVQLLHWFNYRHGLTGYLHWGGNYWSDQPFEQVQPVINDGRTLLPAGDSAIVYPDRDNLSVLSSIRLEIMREGIEDYELFRVLEENNPDAVANLAKQAIPNINDYVREVGEFRNLRRQLLESVGP